MISCLRGRDEDELLLCICCGRGIGRVVVKVAFMDLNVIFYYYVGYEDINTK